MPTLPTEVARPTEQLPTLLKPVSEVTQGPKGPLELEMVEGLGRMLNRKNPSEHIDQIVEALARKKPPSEPPTVDKISGMVTRIGNLEMQMEQQGIEPADKTQKEVELEQLRAELELTLREARSLKKEQEALEKEPEKIYQLENSEKDYLEKNRPKMDGLETRYVDKRTEAKYVNGQIEDFAKVPGSKGDQTPELAGKLFDQESRKIISETVQKQIDRLFNSPEGRLNPEKHQLVTQEIQRLLDLVSQAQKEGDLDPNLSPQVVLRLVEQNVWTLAYQDRVASENLLGDHGIRHIIGHNIRAVEAISDELTRSGQQVRAIDRLIMHQIMIYHDLGYAMDPVRQQVNRGNFKADRGHNILGAKYIRERLESLTDPLRQVFSQEQLSLIHKGVLYHDSSSVDFRIKDESLEARKSNIEGAIHVADNTHAFEDKLPELLYTFPDTLRVMRLMKTAGEIGDNASFQLLQTQLVDKIQGSSQFSVDDKEALVNAAQLLTCESYKFSVGRICGNRPEFTIDEEGKLTIAVQESAIHKEVVGLYGQESYDQLRKFVGDLIGKDKKDVDLNQESIHSTSGKLEIKLKMTEEMPNSKPLSAVSEELIGSIADFRDNSGRPKESLDISLKGLSHPLLRLSQIAKVRLTPLARQEITRIELTEA